MGGKEKFASKLDEVFQMPPSFDDSYYGQTIHEIREMQVVNMGNYAHGNQPIQHMIYLYNYANQSYKAQEKIREVLTKLYAPTPDGYCGDEDNGQTSAWYVFSALGFYPVTPGVDQYVIGSPLFKKATLYLENGKKFQIDAKNNSKDNFYIQSATLNGDAYFNSFINFDAIQKGGRLEFNLDKKPNKDWGSKNENVPYSLSNSELKN
jgi:predicted alpha-1,2-mannosidase